MGEQIRSYFVSGLGQILTFLPNLISALIIFAVGYLLSRVVASLARRLLGRARFDAFVARHLRYGVVAKRSASATVGAAVFWSAPFL